MPITLTILFFQFIAVYHIFKVCSIFVSTINFVIAKMIVTVFPCLRLPPIIIYIIRKVIILMLDFGKRKIHEYGSSYLITIPKAWARDNNIKKGSKVMVSLSKEGKLIISPEGGKNE